MNTFQKYLAPVTILLSAWAFLLFHIGNRWFGHQDINGLVWSMSVRNFRLYGASTLRFAQVFQPGPATLDQLEPYTHHPPLITWLLAMASIPFGFSEATFRFTAACLTMLSIAGLYVLARRLFGERIAPVAMAFYAFTPMLLYFGRMPNHEALSLAICMNFSAILVNWLRLPTSRRWLALAALAAIAAWSAWSAMLYIILLILLALWLGSWQHRYSAVGIGVVFGLALLGVGALTLWQQSSAIQELTSAFLWRTSTDGFMPGSEPFTTGEFIGTQARHILTLATPSLLILVALGFVPAFRRQDRIAKGMLAAALAHGLTYMLVLRNASYVHDYYKIFLIPPLALIGAFGFVRTWNRGRAHRWLRPALSGLLLAWLLIGAYVWLSLHQSSNSADAEWMVEAFSKHTRQNDTILTNLPYVTDAIEYYSFRNIEWEVEPEVAVAHAGEDQVMFLYCGPDIELLREYSREVVAPCAIFRIRR